MLYRNVQFAVGASAAALLLAACSGGGGGTSSAGPGVPAFTQSQTQQQMRPASINRVTPGSMTGRIGLPSGFNLFLHGGHSSSPGFMLEEAKSPKTPKAYVSDLDQGAVFIYNGTHPTNPIGEITTGISEPLGSTTDKSGDLYVTNLGNNTVTVYKPGATSPFKTYTNGLDEPISVALGKDGTLYVSEFAPGEVVEFAKGSMSPARTITISEPEGVALDNKNNLYVSYNNANTGEGAVEKFAPHATSGTDLGITVGFAGDLKINKANGIELGDQDADVIDFYHAGSSTPYGSVSVGGDAYKVGLNSTEKTLYVADVTDVPYFKNVPNGANTGTISSGLESAFGISLSPPFPY